MVYEKILITESGNQVKIIVRGYYFDALSKVKPRVEALIRKAGETKFYRLDAQKLSGLGSYERGEEKQIMEQVIASTGISSQQYDQVLKEFEEIISVSVLW
jgi:hypothetical protein